MEKKYVHYGLIDISALDEHKNSTTSQKSKEGLATV